MTGSALADALIVMDVELRDERVPVLREFEVPSVLIGVPEDTGGLTCIDLDFHAAGARCVDYLADQGHTEVALLGPPAGVYRRGTGFAHRTLRGVRAAARRRGVRIARCPCDNPYEAAFRTVARLLAERPGLTGVVVQNEPAIAPLLDALRAAGREAPGDVSIVAICSDAVVEQVSPRLTSVTIPAESMGRGAVGPGAAEVLDTYVYFMGVVGGDWAMAAAAGLLKGLVGLALILLAVLVPLYVVVITSLSPQAAITRAGGLVLVPDGVSLGAYREILSGGVVTRATLVSLGVTAVGTLVSLGVTVLAAYALSRPGSFGHRPLLLTILMTVLFVPGVIPSYLVVQATGLLDADWSLILPGAVSAFNLVVLRAFFMGIPRELIDSARVDGAGELRVLLRVVLPLSRAATAVIGLFYAVGYWNAFFNALLYLDDNAKWPIQLVLRTYVLEGTAIPGGPTDRGAGFGTAPTLAMKMAIVVLALVPVLFAYPFVQRHFTKGVITGAVKG